MAKPFVSLLYVSATCDLGRRDSWAFHLDYKRQRFSKDCQITPTVCSIVNRNDADDKTGCSADVNLIQWQLEHRTLDFFNVLSPCLINRKSTVWRCYWSYKFLQALICLMIKVYLVMISKKNPGLLWMLTLMSSNAAVLGKHLIHNWLPSKTKPAPKSRLL